MRHTSRERRLEPRARGARFLFGFFLLLALTWGSEARADTTPVLAEGFSMRQLYRPLEWALGSQRRMLQVGTVGICFALWVMMKK